MPNFKSVEKIIVAAGWEHVRTTGSHYIYHKCGYPRPAVIPNHSKLSWTVIKSLEKLTGLTLR